MGSSAAGSTYPFSVKMVLERRTRVAFSVKFRSVVVPLIVPLGAVISVLVFVHVPANPLFHREPPVMYRFGLLGSRGSHGHSRLVPIWAASRPGHRGVERLGRLCRSNWRQAAPTRAGRPWRSAWTRLSSYGKTGGRHSRWPPTWRNRIADGDSLRPRKAVF